MSDSLLSGDWVVERCERAEIRPFIEQWHYSGSINGVMSKYCFKLLHSGELKGAMLFGSLGMANAWKKYGDEAEDVIELRRLCCIDDTPKNTESFFIGKCLAWLKKNTKIKTVVSYADQNFGHQGIIYQATNFNKLGYTSSGKVIMWKGKRFHDKAIRTKYKGELKPFAKRLKDALDAGEAHYEKSMPKVIYVKQLTPKPKAKGLK